MKRLRAFAAATVASFTISITSASSQSFSCTFGQPACLDYGAKVCSSLAKCVDQSAVCFDSYTCNFKGFVCKSDYDEAVAEIKAKVRRYNSLVDDINNLRVLYAALESEHNTANDKLSSLRRTQVNLISCLESADTLEEAQDCAP